MASKVKDVMRLIGRNDPNIGSVLYHARDGAGPDGALGANKRHKIRKALYKVRMRASGMTDDIYGSKESGGAFNNKFEKEPKDGADEA